MLKTEAISELTAGSSADFKEGVQPRVLAAIPHLGLGWAKALLASPAMADSTLRAAERCGEIHDPYASSSPAKALLQSRIDLLQRLHDQDVALDEARSRLTGLEAQVAALVARFELSEETGV